LEKSIEGVLDKFDLSLNDVFLGTNELKNKVVSGLSEENLETAFNEANYNIEIAFDKLKENLFDIDKTLIDTGNKYKQNALNNIQNLKTKAVEAQKRKYEISLRQIDRLSVNLFPNSNLQERELNFFYFANKYGMELLDKIMEDLEINKFEHQVIPL
ncbi:MAG: bacillithiol biosynthesis protein BshC, partial [Methanococcaceae archaeon]